MGTALTAPPTMWGRMKDGEGAQHSAEGDVSYSPALLGARHLLKHIQAPRASDAKGPQPALGHPAGHGASTTSPPAGHITV